MPHIQNIQTSLTNEVLRDQLRQIVAWCFSGLNSLTNEVLRDRADSGFVGSRLIWNRVTSGPTGPTQPLPGSMRPRKWFLNDSKARRADTLMPPIFAGSVSALRALKCTIISFRWLRHRQRLCQPSGLELQSNPESASAQQI